MFRFVGDDGVIDVSFTRLKLKRVGIAQPSPPSRSSRDTTRSRRSPRPSRRRSPAKLAERCRPTAHDQAVAAYERAAEKFQVPRGYDERYDHFVKFFRSVRERQARS